MSSQPFEILRWDSPNDPTLSFLERWMEREKLPYTMEEIPKGTKSKELKFPYKLVRVVVSGHVQYSFPGYGVVELNPGDRIDIERDIIYDMIVDDDAPVVTLNATVTGTF